jgi:hypothetical protein
MRLNAENLTYIRLRMFHYKNFGTGRWEQGVSELHWTPFTRPLRPCLATVLVSGVTTDME